MYIYFFLSNRDQHVIAYTLKSFLLIVVPAYPYPLLGIHCNNGRVSKNV